MIYATPECGPEEQAAIARIKVRWSELRFYVAQNQKRWLGSVRRVLAARANQGSNSIEGYHISTEDAIAALQGAVEPSDSRWEDWQANLGYRRAMTYVLQLANDPHFLYTSALLRSLHFMMVEYDLEASPGLWRPGPIWVRNDLTGEIVYEGPEVGYVPALVEDLQELYYIDEEMVLDAIRRRASFNLIHLPRCSRWTSSCSGFALTVPSHSAASSASTCRCPEGWRAPSSHQPRTSSSPSWSGTAKRRRNRCAGRAATRLVIMR